MTKCAHAKKFKCALMKNTNMQTLGKRCAYEQMRTYKTGKGALVITCADAKTGKAALMIKCLYAKTGKGALMTSGLI